MELSVSRIQEEVTEEDLWFVIKNPWKFTYYEWKLYNIHNEKIALELLLEQVKLARKDGYSKTWRTQDNLPLAILAAYKVEDTKLDCFFIASKHMEEHRQSLKVSFELRKILEVQSYSYKGCTLRLYSESKEIESQTTWLRFLGFKYKPEGNLGNYRHFEYQSKV
ncbi:hypothetical protein [Winogradskyella aquimaris]|uniref:N-acetyltransferase domain-containing protein n=1 Tax=Winogradskyella aquimaris TaxID=864074 RepID=A0ABU5EJQ4_9FLAO|nr:hypothetical protein [Winogradskyella aquimaris]MDY2586596.1 hypothetical protein [Winogradskyella aquimaris]